MTDEVVTTPQVVEENKRMSLQDLFLNAMKVQGKTISIGHASNAGKYHKPKRKVKAARKIARASRKRNRS